MTGKPVIQGGATRLVAGWHRRRGEAAYQRPPEPANREEEPEPAPLPSFAPSPEDHRDLAWYFTRGPKFRSLNSRNRKRWELVHDAESGACPTLRALYTCPRGVDPAIAPIVADPKSYFPVADMTPEACNEFLAAVLEARAEGDWHTGADVFDDVRRTMLAKLCSEYATYRDRKANAAAPELYAVFTDEEVEAYFLAYRGFVRLVDGAVQLSIDGSFDTKARRYGRVQRATWGGWRFDREAVCVLANDKSFRRALKILQQDMADAVPPPAAAPASYHPEDGEDDGIDGQNYEIVTDYYMTPGNFLHVEVTPRFDPGHDFASVEARENAARVNTERYLNEYRRYERGESSSPTPRQHLYVTELSRKLLVSNTNIRRLLEQCGFPGDAWAHSVRVTLAWLATPAGVKFLQQARAHQAAQSLAASHQPAEQRHARCQKGPDGRYRVKSMK